jgi:hypothetical protein
MFLTQIKIFMQTIMSTDCKRSAGLLRLEWSGSLCESLSRAFSAVIKNYDHPQSALPIHCKQIGFSGGGASLNLITALNTEWAEQSARRSKPAGADFYPVCAPKSISRKI